MRKPLIPHSNPWVPRKRCKGARAWSHNEDGGEKVITAICSTHGPMDPWYSWYSNFSSTSFTFLRSHIIMLVKVHMEARMSRPRAGDVRLLILIHPLWLHNEAIRTSLEPINPKIQAF